MAYVFGVGRSIAFYEHLGFTATNSHSPEDGADPVWAHMDSGNAHLTLAKASDPIDPMQQAILFYLYFENIQAAHTEFKNKGLPVGEIAYPFYCPQGEFRLTDPDGYCLMLTHV
ncbi:MAG: VOC family protein [Xanthomonadales bacterium]|nr:VOC family protein [Xanthomonadales bacterium]